jgi:hypothetical protein
MQMAANDGSTLRTRSLSLVILGLILSLGIGVPSSVSGQTELYRVPDTPGVVVFRSTDPAPVMAQPTTVYSAPVAAPWMESSAAMPTTTYYSPDETTVFSPTVPAADVWEWTPVSGPTPVTTYSPVVPTVPAASSFVGPTTSFFAPATVAPGAITVFRPTVTFQPVVVPAAQAVVPVTAVPAIPAGPRVTVRPKVYVEGQPLRNLWRAITP